jgi:phosphoribosylanthranilate isomerase
VAERPPVRTRVKICGVMRREDALAVDRAGADYLGVILSGGFSRSVAPEAAASLVDDIRPIRVAVLVGEDPATAEASARAIGAGVIQLHGEEAPSVLAELRSRGAWKLWKAVRARGVDDIERAVERYADHADGILVEGWKEGVVGGGGARLDLDPGRVSELIPERLDFILAGGLDSDTVGDAVTAFRPHVVDVSSGVERAKGEKDPLLVTRFVEAARRPAAPAVGVETSSEEVAR